MGFLSVLAGSAQTIDSVRISPTAPTTAIPVMVHVYGFFTSLTSPGSVTQSYLGGNVYQVNVHRCQGMALALDYTHDSISLGILSAGSYTAMATMYSAMADSSGNCQILSPTGNGSTTFSVTQSSGIKDVRSETVSIRYNTNEKSIHIDLPPALASCKFSLLDLSGRTLMERLIETKASVIRTDVPAGLYLVKLYECPAPIVKKMVIN